MTQDRDPVLQSKQLCMDFGGVRALDDFDISVFLGEICGLIGPNGSGKSTFLNVVSRIYRPSSGIVSFRGRDLSSWSMDELCFLGISRTFQNIRLFSSLTALENVLVGLHTKMLKSFWKTVLGSRESIRSEQEAREEALSMLRFVSLSDKASEFAKNLSYGEQRRLEITRALASDPLLVMLDEPTAGMSASEASDIVRLIGALKAKGKAILVIEHNMRVIMKVADRIVVLDSGRKIAEGTPHEIRSNEKVQQAYLGKE